MATAAQVAHYQGMALGASRLKCVSDFDPGANDYTDAEAEALSGIEEADGKLAMAREAIESRAASSLLVADSLMIEAAGYLIEGDPRDLLAALRRIVMQCDTSPNGVKVVGIAKAAIAKAVPQ